RGRRSAVVASREDLRPPARRSWPSTPASPPRSPAGESDRVASRGVPLYLTEAEVAELMTPADALEAVEGSFRRLAAGELENVPRRRMRLEGGVFAVMSAVDRGLGLAGLKSYAWLEDATPFVVVLFDTENAGLAAVIEADKLGQLRTGAASGVAAKHLAREGAASLGIIGC